MTDDPTTSTTPLVLTRLPGGPTGVLNYFGTENASGKPAIAFRERLGRCYALTAIAIAFSDDILLERARLVHGSWKHADAPARISHAWLEIPTVVSSEPLIWEPVTAGLYQHREFKAYAAMWDERTYDRTTARRMIADNATYGPWHEGRYR